MTIPILSIVIIGTILYAILSRQKSENKLYTGTYHDPVAPELRLERDKYLNRINSLVNEGNFEEATLLCDTLERLCPQSPICFLTGGIISHKLKDSMQSRLRLIRAKEIYDSDKKRHAQHARQIDHRLLTGVHTIPPHHFSDHSCNLLVSQALIRLLRIPPECGY